MEVNGSKAINKPREEGFYKTLEKIKRKNICEVCGKPYENRIKVIFNEEKRTCEHD